MPMSVLSVVVSSCRERSEGRGEDVLAMCHANECVVSSSIIMSREDTSVTVVVSN